MELHSNSESRKKILGHLLREKPRTVDPIILELLHTRVKRGLTQRDLAHLVGIHNNTIERAERGVGTTTYANVVAWANTLGFTLELRSMT